MKSDADDDGEFLDYRKKYTVDCNKTLNFNDTHKVLIIHVIDRYMFLIICPIAFICSTIIILTFILYKKTREPPGYINK